VPRATASEGPYTAARAGFESATLQAKGVESTNAPPRPAFRHPPGLNSQLMCVNDDNNYDCVCFLGD